MATSKNILIERVSAKIDEVLPPGDNVNAEALIEGPVNYIDSELDRSADFILRQAPVTMVKQVMKSALKHFPISISPATPEANPDVRVIYDQVELTSIIPVPQDFLRFISLKLDSWRSPVMELLRQEDPKYRKQKNNFFYRGTAHKPVAALIGFTDYLPAEVSASFPNNKLALECFTTKAAPTIETFHYVPRTLAEDMPDDMIDALCWECASRVLLIMKRPTESQAAKAQVGIYFDNKYGMYGEVK